MLQHSTEYRYSTDSGGTWTAWTLAVAAEDCGAHTLVIPGLPIGIYWAQLRISALPITGTSTVLISETFAFDVAASGSFLGVSQQPQTATIAASVRYGAAVAQSQAIQSVIAAGGVLYTGAVAADQQPQTAILSTDVLVISHFIDDSSNVWVNDSGDRWII